MFFLEKGMTDKARNPFSLDLETSKKLFRVCLNYFQKLFLVFGIMNKSL